MNRELKPSWLTGELQAPLISLVITVVTAYFGVSESEAVQMVSNVVFGCVTLAGMVAFVLGRHNVKVAWIEYLKTLPAPKDPPASPGLSLRVRPRTDRDEVAQELRELRELLEGILASRASPPSDQAAA